MKSVLLVLDNKVDNMDVNNYNDFEHLYNLMKSEIFDEIIYSKLIYSPSSILVSSRISDMNNCNKTSKFNLNQKLINSLTTLVIEREHFSAYNSSLDFILSKLKNKDKDIIIYIAGLGLENSVIHTYATLNSLKINTVILKKYCYVNQSNIRDFIDSYIKYLITEDNIFDEAVNLKSSVDNLSLSTLSLLGG